MRSLLFVFLITSAASGQRYTALTIGGGVPPATPVSAKDAPIGVPLGVASDANGNQYFTSVNSLFKIDADGVLTRVAGNGRGTFAGDDGPASAAQLFQPRGLAISATAGIYIADSLNGRVRRIDPDGEITTVAGGGSGTIQNGVAATSVAMTPVGVALDAGGLLYIATPSQILRLSTEGTITILAGGGASIPGDGGPATSAQLLVVTGVAVDNAGRTYISEAGANRIRRVSGGLITTVAGTGSPGFSGDGGLATAAQLSAPSGVAVDIAANLYIADTGNNRIRFVSSSGTITTLAGGGTGPVGDGGPPTNATLNRPNGVAVYETGNVLVADSSQRVRLISQAVIQTIAGNGTGVSGDGGAATSAQFGPVSAVAAAPQGVYVGDAINGRVRLISPQGIVTTVAGGGSPTDSNGDGGPATSAVVTPLGLARSSDDLLIADVSRIRRVAANGTISTVAGGGQDAGEGVAALSALLSPADVAVHPSGSMYIGEASRHRIRRVVEGTINTIAGNGTSGFSGDGGSATAAQLNDPNGIAFDSAGSLYIADTGNNRIRRVSAEGVISTVAGSGPAGFAGDGGPALSARLDHPRGVALDGAGNLFIADTGNSRIRIVSPAGTISTIAGSNLRGYAGDGGIATAGSFNLPSRLAIDSIGRAVIADTANNAVRLLVPANAQCTFTVTPPSIAVDASAASASLSIQTTATCGWSIANLPSWASASPATGTGPATVTLNISANAGSARSAILTAAGIPVSLAQQGAAGGCTYALNPVGQSFTNTGGTGTITVTAGDGCAWSVSNSLPWLTISSGSSGTGAGSVAYRVTSNPGAPPRSGTISIAGQPFAVEQLGALPADMTAIGSMAQVAAGGGWKTTFTFVNNGTAPALIRLNLTGDSGAALNLPLRFPQTGGGPVLASTLERTIHAGASLIIESDGPESEQTQQGWARLLSNGTVSGFAVFRQRAGANAYEAVVPLETRSASGYVLAFDNTGNLATGVAIANLASQQGTTTVVIRNDEGAPLQITNLGLNASAHNAFVLSEQYPVTAQKRGTIEFQPGEDRPITVLGLRFDQAAFTTIPVMVK